MQHSRLEAPAERFETDIMRLPEFYFLRHGLTDANLNRIMCGGGWDVALNAAGLSQAFTVAQGPLSKCGELKTICSSPMRRATQTANIVNAVLKLPMIVVEDLREIMVGEWENQAWHAIPDPFVDVQDPPGGESIAGFRQRTMRAVIQALEHPGPVLIVAHGGIWFALTNQLGIEHKFIDNCALRRVWRNSSTGSWCSEPVS
jgi:broad specificity phosphatase PhoE